MEPGKSGSGIRVLSVNSNIGDGLVLRSLLATCPASPFRLSNVTSYAQGLLYINKNIHDIYLIRHGPGMEDGIRLLETIEPQKYREPFIILTEHGDDATEQLAMELGASDYLVMNSLTAEQLSRALRHALQRKRTEEQRLQYLIDVNQAKDEFISLASHQLRTPATAVKQYLGMVIEGYVGELNSSQKTMLETAYASNERQLQIVSDLLRVAKVDAGRIQITRKAVDLGQLVHEVVDELASKFRQHRQRVAYKQPARPLTATIDKENFRMVLENIVDNASKYSGPDSTVTIQLAKTKDHIEVSIADQGVGIKPEDFDKLFIKFSRIDNPLSTEVGGSGLGLYWAKKIVDLHGGTIVVSSREGEGSTFTIMLPRK